MCGCVTTSFLGLSLGEGDGRASSSPREKPWERGWVCHGVLKIFSDWAGVGVFGRAVRVRQ